MYLERERLISISVPKVDVEELEAKIESRVDERSKQLQRLVNGLTAENLELRGRMARLELEATEKTERFKKVEHGVLKLKETVKKLLEFG